MRGLLDTFAETLRHGAPSELQQLFPRGRSLAAPRSCGVVPCGSVRPRSGSRDVNRGLLGQLSWGEYSTSIFSSAAVDPVAVKAVQGPSQRKHDRTLRLELDYNPRGAPFESVAVFDESRQGK